MPTADQTLDRILETVRRLPEAQRARLLQEIAAESRTDQARAAARHLRSKYRLDAPKRRRMSALLAKGNAGTLTGEEKKELDGLVDEFERKTLELANAVADAVNSPPARSKLSDNS